MATFISHSPDETEVWAKEFARRARAGLVIGLVGDLGAGKTQFAKGFALGLGVAERVLSPTFALLHVYSSGRLSLCHIDFYRLDGDAQIIAAGLVDYFTPAGVALIEWWDRWTGAMPLLFVRVELVALSETDRKIIYEDALP
jgi:tRNA threonylcarbamoyladenosine biosynthesis protein TsaE